MVSSAPAPVGTSPSQPKHFLKKLRRLNPINSTYLQHPFKRQLSLPGFYLRTGVLINIQLDRYIFLRIPMLLPQHTNLPQNLSLNICNLYLIYSFLSISPIKSHQFKYKLTEKVNSRHNVLVSTPLAYISGSPIRYIHYK